MLPKAYTSSSKLRIGVLLAPPPVQFLDIAPVDALYMMSKEYIVSISLLPEPVKNLALEEVQVYYIAAANEPGVNTHQGVMLTTPDKDSANSSDGRSGHQATYTASLTTNLQIGLTSTVTSTEVQPGALEVLLIPGPDPASHPSEASLSFIRAHASCGTTDIITICTGIYPACYAGICDGRVVTGPRGLLSDLRTKFKAVKQFEATRWSWTTLELDKQGATNNDEGHGDRPAELWTAAGITNGQDCIAAYMRKHFNKELAEIVCRMADIGERPREYDNGQAVETVWWVTRILRVALKGLFGKS